MVREVLLGMPQKKWRIDNFTGVVVFGLERNERMQKTELKTCVELDWAEYNNKIAKHIEEDDINNFTNWPIVSNTMVYGDNRGAFEHLRGLPDWDVWKEFIREVPEGNPIPNRWCSSSSGNMIHQANHLSRFLSRTSCKLKGLKAIYEFGGGYGCLCRLIHNLGFSGKYAIMDLPAVQFLQKWYLGRTIKQGQITYLLDSDEFTKQMEDGGLFIANWSLSEVAYLLRDKILQTACKKMDYIFLSFQGSHGELNNLDYFIDKIFTNPRYKWDIFVVPHTITARVDHFYLFGEILQEFRKEME